jgi:hypothetical protein
MQQTQFFGILLVSMFIIEFVLAIVFGVDSIHSLSYSQIRTYSFACDLPGYLNSTCYNLEDYKSEKRCDDFTGYDAAWVAPVENSRTPDRDDAERCPYRVYSRNDTRIVRGFTRYNLPLQPGCDPQKANLTCTLNTTFTVFPETCRSLLANTDPTNYAASEYFVRCLTDNFLSQAPRNCLDDEFSVFFGFFPFIAFLVGTLTVGYAVLVSGHTSHVVTVFFLALGGDVDADKTAPGFVTLAEYVPDILIIVFGTIYLGITSGGIVTECSDGAMFVVIYVCALVHFPGQSLLVSSLTA